MHTIQNPSDSFKGLEARLLAPIVYPITKPRKRRRDFSKTVSASLQRMDRKLIESELRGGEQVVMRQIYNLWMRHVHKAPAMPISVAKVVALTRWSARHVKTLMQRLIARGWLRLIAGGCGRGNARVFSLDLTAMRQALAPDLFETDKGCKNESAYNKELRVCRKHWWKAGLWGRSDRFRQRFVRAVVRAAGVTAGFWCKPDHQSNTLDSLSPHSASPEARSWETNLEEWV